MKEKLLDFLKKLGGTLLFVMIMLMIPALPFVVSAGCVSCAIWEESRGAYDKTHGGFSGLMREVKDAETGELLAWKGYCLRLPPDAEFIYGRDHSFWRSSETFIIFRLAPRRIEGYRKGMSAYEIMRLLVDTTSDPALPDEEGLELNGLSASELEEETMLKPPRYEGEELKFYYSVLLSYGFRCELYCGMPDPDGMVFALCSVWG